MITEDIINELDKFITNYKTLKTDNQNLNQFKTEVKTALNSKGIINTSEDSEVISSVNTYTPPTGGSAPLDADYLKKVGLLSDDFVGTPTERDLKVLNFIIPDPYNDRVFYTSEYIPSSFIKVELNGERLARVELDVTSSTDSRTVLVPSKFRIPQRSYYIYILNLKDKGTYKVTANIRNLVFEKTFDYDPNTVKSMEDFLIYATNIKSKKVLIYDGEGVKFTEYIDKSKVSDKLRDNILNPLDGRWNEVWGPSSIGYVLNVRTGRAYKINVNRDISTNNTIKKEERKYLAIINFEGKLDITEEPAILSICVANNDPLTLKKDISYQDGDTLVFAFHRDIAKIVSHSYPEEAVAEYLKKIFKGMPNHIALENGE